MSNLQQHGEDAAKAQEVNNSNFTANAGIEFEPASNQRLLAQSQQLEIDRVPQMGQGMQG